MLFSLVLLFVLPLFFFSNLSSSCHVVFYLSFLDWYERLTDLTPRLLDS